MKNIILSSVLIRYSVIQFYFERAYTGGINKKFKQEVIYGKINPNELKIGMYLLNLLIYSIFA